MNSGLEFRSILSTGQAVLHTSPWSPFKGVAHAQCDWAGNVLVDSFNGHQRPAHLLCIPYFRENTTAQNDDDDDEDEDEDEDDDDHDDDDDDDIVRLWTSNMGQM